MKPGSFIISKKKKRKKKNEMLLTKNKIFLKLIIKKIMRVVLKLVLILSQWTSNAICRNSDEAHIFSVMHYLSNNHLRTSVLKLDKFFDSQSFVVPPTDNTFWALVSPVPLIYCSCIWVVFVKRLNLTKIVKITSCIIWSLKSVEERPQEKGFAIIEIKKFKKIKSK